MTVKFAFGPEKSTGLSSNGPSRAKVIHLYNMVKYSRVKLNPYFKVFFHYNAVFIDLKSLIPKNRVIAPTSPKIAFFFFIFADPLYAEFSERRLFPPGEKIQFKR